MYADAEHPSAGYHEKSHGESFLTLAFEHLRPNGLYLFDEPEAGIDLWSFQNLIQVFERMREKTDGSILIISHQERILNIADEIVVIADGSITSQGPKDEILPKLLGTASAVDACERFYQGGVQK